MNLVLSLEGHHYLPEEVLTGSYLLYGGPFLLILWDKISLSTISTACEKSRYIRSIS